MAYGQTLEACYTESIRLAGIDVPWKDSDIQVGLISLAIVHFSLGLQQQWRTSKRNLDR